MNGHSEEIAEKLGLIESEIIDTVSIENKLFYYLLAMNPVLHCFCPVRLGIGRWRRFMRSIVER